ncbi:hypothetical protein AB9P05_06555 [Roseivirga sp. BDSF3-8]|uniref:hypothetical protein n=1 Tax=Roseivirga sp. BDSF3-8 TaxID=3241598 RepID=UPI003531D846
MGKSFYTLLILLVFSVFTAKPVRGEGIRGPLQVYAESLALSGTSLENGTEINWSSTQEYYVVKFVIQRADHSLNFRDYFEVTASNEDAQNHYQHLDPYPRTINYYRIKVVNVDGEEAFSKTIHVSRGEEIARPDELSEGVVIYPNPAPVYGKVNLRLDKPGNINRISLSKYDGDDAPSVLIGESGYRNQVEFILPESTTPGIYLLHCQIDGNRICKKLVID